MLFRLVRPVLRKGSRNRYFIRRIPNDVLERAAGLTLSIPVGDEFRSFTISPRADSIRLSLGTDDPVEVKTRQSALDAHLETIWQALRNAKPVSLTHQQATALSSKLYRAWAEGESRERTFAIEHTEDGWQTASAHVEGPEWDSAIESLDKAIGADKPGDLEKRFGAIIDRLLLEKGINRVDDESRGLILVEFARALRDAIEHRKRNAEGDYSPDPKSERFPVWTASQSARQGPTPAARASLTALVEGWWAEALAAGRKPSTHESYRNTMAKFVDFIRHDDAARVTPDDVLGFKDSRIKAGVSPKTVKDSDLAGLKTVFGWAKSNRKMATNPAEGITLKVGKGQKLRSKGFTDAEALAILRHASHYKPKGENPKLASAKFWMPWLCALTGARVGEMLQLRKEDLRHEQGHWVIRITPEAGTVKHADAPLHQAYQCVLKEIREPHAHGRHLYGLVQLRETAQEPEGDFPGDGRWPE